jgi:hypothetical protein
MEDEVDGRRHPRGIHHEAVCVEYKPGKVLLVVILEESA